MIDLRRLRHLVTLADSGNFTRAAQQLRISQPALSRSIAGLEAECGERLFERTGEGVIPTALARPMIQRARQMLADAERFDRDMAAAARGVAGVLAFGAGPLVAALGFAPVLARLARDRPALDVRASIGGGHMLSDAVRRGDLEFAVIARSVLVSTAGLAVAEMGTQALAVLVRAGHPLAGRAGLAAHDLSAFPLATGSAPDQDAGRETLVPSSGLIVCDSFTILREIVATSDAMWLASTGFGSDALVELDYPLGGARELQLVTVTAPDRTLSPAAREALRLLSAALA